MYGVCDGRVVVRRVCAGIGAKNMKDVSEEM